MINTFKLRKVWKTKGYTQDDIADILGMESGRLEKMLQESRLTTKEVDKLIEVLGINDPLSIFFANTVA